MINNITTGAAEVDEERKSSTQQTNNLVTENEGAIITQTLVVNTNKSDFTEVFSWGSDRFG